MGDLVIDSDALASASNRLRGIAQELYEQARRHDGILGEIEGLVAGAAQELLSNLENIAIWDGGYIWSRWGFDGIAGRLASSRGVVDAVRSAARDVVRQVLDAHPGALNAVIADDGALVDPAMSGALAAMEQLGGLLSPGAILWLVRNPEAIFDGLRTVRSALSGAEAQANNFINFLDRLAMREENLIAEILQRTGLVAPIVAGVDTLIGWAGNQAFNAGQQAVGLLQGIAQYFADGSKIGEGDLSGAVDALDHFGDVLVGVGVVTTIIANLHASLYTQEVQDGGAILHAGADLATGPYGLAVEAVVGVTHFETWGMSWEQHELAQQYTGQIRSELQQSSDDLAEVSKHADTNAPFTDLAKFYVDAGPLNDAMMLSNPLAMPVLIVTNPRLAGDAYNTVRDAATTILSVPQGIIDTGIAKAQQDLVTINTTVQNLPLPSGVKHVSTDVTDHLLHLSNDVGHFVTHLSDDIPSWSSVQGVLSHVGWP